MTLSDTCPEAPDLRYVRQIVGMLHDANGSESLESLADALAWGLAFIANEAGMGVTGDILWQLGRYIRHLAEQDRALAEAKQAQRNGQAIQ